MKRILLATAIAAGLAVPTSAQFCPSCVQNSAVAQSAQFNVSSATVRGALTVGSINISSMTVSTITAGAIFGGGQGITNLNASQILSGHLSSAAVSGPYPGITSVGAIASGSWQGGIVASPFGGTGANLGTANPGSIPYFASIGTMTALPPDVATYLLQTNGPLPPSWTHAPQVVGTNIVSIPMANLIPGQLPMDISINDASISTVSAAKVIGNISGFSANMVGILPIGQLGFGTLPNGIPASSITVTGVAPGTYGISGFIPRYTVGTDGRLTFSTQTAFSISPSSITPGPLPPGVTVPPGNITAGTLPGNVIASSIAATGVSAGTYGGGLYTVQVTVGGDGRASSIANTPILVSPSSITAGVLPYNVTVPPSSILPGALPSNVVASSFNATGVTPGAYGDASHAITFSVGGDGRLTASSQTSISLTSANLQSGAYPNVFIPAANVSSGSLGPSVIASSVGASGITPGSCGDATHSCTITFTPDGRAIFQGQAGITGVPAASVAAENVLPGSLNSGVKLSTANVVPGFNGANELVQLNASGQLPALDARLLTALTAPNLVGAVPVGSVSFSTITSAISTIAASTRTVTTNGGQLFVQDTGTSYSLSLLGISSSCPSGQTFTQVTSSNGVITGALCANLGGGSGSSGGWNTTGAVVYLTTATNSVLIQSTLTISGSAFSVGGSTLIVSGGKVGIGTTSPASALDVEGTIQADNITIDNGGSLITSGSAGTVISQSSITTSGGFFGNGSHLTGVATTTISMVLDDFTSQCNGVTSNFSLSQAPSSSTALMVRLDGLSLLLGRDFTFIPPQTVSITTVPQSGCSNFFAQYLINVPAAGNISSSGSPSWSKYTVPYTAFNVAYSTADIQLFSLSAKTIIQSVVIKQSTSFSGGTATGATVSVGLSGNLTKYASAFDVFQSAASNTAQTSHGNFVEDFAGATSVRIAAVATGDTLNNLAAGSVDVWVQTSTLP